MGGRSHTLDSTPIDAPTLAAFIACEKALQLEQALELLEALRPKGLEPNVVVYNAAISAS